MVASALEEPQFNPTLYDSNYSHPVSIAGEYNRNPVLPQYRNQTPEYQRLTTSTYTVVTQYGHSAYYQMMLFSMYRFYKLYIYTKQKFKKMGLFEAELLFVEYFCTQNNQCLIELINIIKG